MVELFVWFLAVSMMPCKYLRTDALPVVQEMQQKPGNCMDRPIGQTFQKTDCEYCICHSANEEPRCYFEECWDPKCVDPVKIPGQCCKICLYGPNCQHNGIVINEKEQRIIGDLICSCLDSEVDTFGEDQPTAVCTSSEELRTK